MGFPQFPEKFAKPAVLNAQDIVDYRRRLGRMPDLPGLEGVLLCLERGLPRGATRQGIGHRGSDGRPKAASGARARGLQEVGWKSGLAA